MPFDDIALDFNCQGEQLFGVLSPGAPDARRGVLVVVGGPQYRAGSHRQFTLLARSLAQQGIPVLRFDYRGMGDSGGAARDFEAVQEDLRSAIDAFVGAVPGLQQVVLWGLCDAASAALFYARNDPRVSGLVLLNPWARTTLGAARTTLRHYYLQRLTSPELWQKIRSGRFDYAAAARSLASLLRTASGRAAPAASAASTGGVPISAMPARAGADAAAAAAAEAAPAVGAGGRAVGAAGGLHALAAPIASTSPSAPAASASLHQRMLDGFAGFGGPVLLLISGTDLTAREFLDMANGSRQWRRLLADRRVTRHSLPEADHTFSTRVWRDQVAGWTAGWIRSW